VNVFTAATNPKSQIKNPKFIPASAAGRSA
jgi:hypothetical protein